MGTTGQPTAFKPISTIPLMDAKEFDKGQNEPTHNDIMRSMAAGGFDEQSEPVLTSCIVALMHQANELHQLANRLTDSVNKLCRIPEVVLNDFEEEVKRISGPLNPAESDTIGMLCRQMDSISVVKHKLEYLAKHLEATV